MNALVRRLCGVRRRVRSNSPTPLSTPLQSAARSVDRRAMMRHMPMRCDGSDASCCHVTWRPVTTVIRSPVGDASRARLCSRHGVSLCHCHCHCQRYLILSLSLPMSLLPYTVTVTVINTISHCHCHCCCGPHCQSLLRPEPARSYA